jgi:hypothetical protein
MPRRDRRNARGKLLAAAAALAAGAVSTAPHAAVLNTQPDGQGAVAVRLEGPINPGDAEKLSRLAAQARASGLKVQTVALNSLGGEMFEGLELARIITGLRLATAVRGRDECASACFFAFAAGRTRSTSKEGRLGVHGVSEGRLGETESAKSLAVDMARALARLNVPASIVGEMILTPPSRMRWLTADEMRLMGVEVGR